MHSKQLGVIVEWAARMGAICFVLFISLFSLDAFNQPNWPVALLIHLIPSFLIVALIVIAWRQPRIGGILFIFTSIAMMMVSHFEATVIYIPALIIGGLFLLKR